MQSMDGAGSRQIHWARYDEAASQVKIDFKDKNGAKSSTYRYGSPEKPFTFQDWYDFQASHSKGQHFAQHIRNSFPYVKISGPSKRVAAASAVKRPAGESGDLF